MYNIQQVNDSFNTFFQVFLNGVIVAQRNSFEAAKDFVSKQQATIAKLSKVTTNMASRHNVPVVFNYGELTITNSIVYAVFKGQFVLVRNLTKAVLPSIITNEKELRNVIKALRGMF